MSKARWQVTASGPAASTSVRIRASSMRAVGGEAADHDAGNAEVAQRLDVADHRAELGIGIQEIAAARAHDHMERNVWPA